MLASPAIANMGIPIGFFIGFLKLSDFWLILLVIAIEAAAIWLIFRLNWKRAIFASIAVNTITAVVGFAIYPLAYGVLEPILAPVIIDFTGGGYNVELIAIIIGVSLIDTGIELYLLAYIFQAISSWPKGTAYLLFNLLTTTLLFYPVIM